VIERFQLLRNVGQFDSVSTGALLPVSAFNLIYAENGRGKTTLAAILRSLGTGIATPITAASSPEPDLCSASRTSNLPLSRSLAWNYSAAFTKINSP
jgi:hypothetical protein